jgi:hypothetical protein
MDTRLMVLGKRIPTWLIILIVAAIAIIALMITAFLVTHGVPHVLASCGGDVLSRHP